MTASGPLLTRIRVTGLGLGPALVVAVAYIDPGNVATNVTAGASHGYLLVWVVVTASLTGILVQYLAAKSALVTGRTLPELCRERLPRPVSLGLWVQAEGVAAATDLAEVVGGAIALQLLLGMPLPAGALLTAAVSLLILAAQSERSSRRFEAVIAVLLAVVLLAFTAAAIASRPDPAGVATGLLPRLDGSASALLAVGILGATVMPHAIYLHTGLIAGALRAAAGRAGRPGARVGPDVIVAMSVATVANLALLLAAAAALSGRGELDLEASHAGFGATLGPVWALVFAVALLVSGVASTSVGTYAGAVIMQGFLRRRVPLTVRRGVTLVPALVVLTFGVNPTTALVVSQVVLSFGIPFALWPLVAFTSDPAVMGRHANGPWIAWPARVAALAITAANVALIALMLIALMLTP